ncbi:hypothetical protein PTSG_01060 [Salpingoeca rosetta]|uniref:RING-type domain-containing protein n=1 Tax=Salpingoeca rosetta (strain ATCC 50818 / BSB-021) TaxID=946362 RepID=F2TYA1_SALR5|nr:uncharacterized protein PTSG_01060 [Salpingoeca rosetta]EGD76360.1 hypothetical protein PTSG_01060 [Salpingoeca rosetta]|eukprot:XP_004998535.1 hypothetical protein PTSG_01060 [Salpingoeca rosetta]
MGNTCATGRRRYQVISGDEVAQETTFDATTDTTQQAAASLSAQQALVRTHSEHADELDTEPQTQAEQTYTLAVANLKLERSDSLENLLTCAICLDFLFEPVRSTCGHSFCRTCLRRLLEFDGSRANCPKCRQSFARMDPDKLEIDRPLAETVQRNFEMEEMAKRKAEAEVDEQEYVQARAARQRREQLMESNPLQLMFESEEDPTRRRILRRDMALLTGLGFSEVMAQKALFVASGTHTEALAWLMHHQHHPDVDVPWNSTQLQEQIALRNTRRVLCGIDTEPTTQVLLAGQLNVSVGVVRHVSILGRKAWLVSTRGFGALAMPEIVFIVKAESEELAVPQCILKLLKKLFRRAKRGAFTADHATIIRFSHDATPFLNNPELTGVMLTREMGQSLQGLPVPHGNFVLALLLFGHEVDWAEHLPCRFLLQLGRNHRGNYPFPITNDRYREPVITEGIEESHKYFKSAIFVKHAICMRVQNPRASSRFRRNRRREPAHWYLLHLPSEAKDIVRRYVDSWNCSTSMPLVCDFALGADGYLLHQNQSARQRMLALPNAVGAAIGGVAITFVRDNRNVGTGGTLHKDVLMFYANDTDYTEIRSALSLGHDIEIKPSNRNLDCGLRIKWLPSAVINSGLSHISSDLFPDRTVYPYSHRVGNLSDGIVLPLIAAETREMLCPDLHPRLTVLGVGVGVSAVELNARIDRTHLEQYLSLLLESVSAKMGKLITEPPSSGDASLITLHIDLEPAGTDASAATYRISKNYGDVCPQAPGLTMRKWSRMLHPLPAPPVTAKVALQVSLELI